MNFSLSISTSHYVKAESLIHLLSTGERCYFQLPTMSEASAQRQSYPTGKAAKGHAKTQGCLRQHCLLRLKQLHQVYGMYAAGILPRVGYRVLVLCLTQYNLHSVKWTRAVHVLWKNDKVTFGVSKPWLCQWGIKCCESKVPHSREHILRSHQMWGTKKCKDKVLGLELRADAATSASVSLTSGFTSKTLMLF